MCMNRAVSNSGMEPAATSRLARLAPLIVLACAQVGTSADNGAFSVAMAEMMRVFGCPLSDVQMASTVYSLMAGTFMLASGLLGMVIGWCRNFRAGLVLAVVGELLCAFSPSIELLIWGGRLMVGLGASLIIPSVLGMVSHCSLRAQSCRRVAGCTRASLTRRVRLLPLWDCSPLCAVFRASRPGAYLLPYRRLPSRSPVFLPLCLLSASACYCW